MLHHMLHRTIYIFNVATERKDTRAVHCSLEFIKRMKINTIANAQVNCTGVKVAGFAYMGCFRSGLVLQSTG